MVIFTFSTKQYILTLLERRAPTSTNAASTYTHNPGYNAKAPQNATNAPRGANKLFCLLLLPYLELLKSRKTLIKFVDKGKITSFAENPSIILSPN